LGTEVKVPALETSTLGSENQRLSWLFPSKELPCIQTT